MKLISNALSGLSVPGIGTVVSSLTAPWLSSAPLNPGAISESATIPKTTESMSEHRRIISSLLVENVGPCSRSPGCRRKATVAPAVLLERPGVSEPFFVLATNQGSSTNQEEREARSGRAGRLLAPRGAQPHGWIQ